MAQLRGSFFPCIRSSLERHALVEVVEARVAVTTRKIFQAGEPNAWYDEGHAVAIYEAVVEHATAQPDLAPMMLVREVGRDAARFAMQSTWRELMAAMTGLIGGTPRMAFEHIPVLWNATRREAGDLVCIESSSKHATTQVTGFAYTASAPWVATWVGHHDALLRHLRFSGTAQLEAADPATGTIRVKTTWGGRTLPRSSTGGFSR